MLAQEKVPKEKCTRSPHRLCRCPAFLAAGGAHNSALAGAHRLRQGARLFPDMLRYSVRATGLGGSSQRRFGFDCTSHPWRSRASQKSPGEARALFEESSVSEIASCASAGLCETRRARLRSGLVVTGKPLGATFLLGTFLWWLKKSTSPIGARPDYKQEPARQGEILRIHRR